MSKADFFLTIPSHNGAFGLALAGLLLAAGAAAQPAAELGGEWEMKLFDNASGNWGGKVEFRPEGAGWTGRIWYSRVTSAWEPITNINYSARTGALTFHRPHGVQDYRVTVKANAMEGTMVERNSGASYRWVAQRGAGGGSSGGPEKATPPPPPPPPQPALAGEWEMKLFDNASGNWGGKVEFRPEGAGWTGRIWYSRVTSAWEPIINISYSAGTGALTFHRPHGVQDYRVTVKANVMEGRMVERNSGASYRWVAQKK